MIVSENQLDEWVRGNARDAQGVIVELIFRLVAASCPRPNERRFPLSDSIGQHGPDGILDVVTGFEPFVPEGRSFWEIGTGVRPGKKATNDYADAVREIPEDIRRQSAFVFVTPLSGRRDWEHTWKPEAQATWLDQRRKMKEWREVHVLDGTKMIDWLRQFPSVELWLAQRLFGASLTGVETPERHWDLIRCIGEPPPLSPEVFLSNREDAREKLNTLFSDTTNQLRFETRYPDQVPDFIAACIAALDDSMRTDVTGRCLIASSPDAWRTLSTLRERHILIADPTLDLTGAVGTKLIQLARRGGHAIIFGSTPGGIPDPASVILRAPRTHQLQAALEQCGYREERARTLAHRSGANLGSLLRCLQNLSLLPQWAEDTAAADLAIAAALGSWSEICEPDLTAVEYVTGKAYGEWIARIREIALRANAPLTHHEGRFRFIARFEGWYALGPQLFDAAIQQLQALAVKVLSEKDPQFELAPEERFAASMHGKILGHSQSLRTGLAEFLALLGTHPQALTSSSAGNPQRLAALAVRTLLAGADWQRWAGLNEVLPLLAEASPDEFLSAIEQALNHSKCAFDQVMAEERGTGTGRTYMSGTLWGLETLAWDPDYFMRTALTLGQLAARDPGGTWSNRPVNSLKTIFLPWLPQTCVPIERRVAAVKMLLSEVPDVGWDLLLSLLPEPAGTSSGSRRPAWRESIPQDWSSSVSREDYWQQIERYSALALAEAIARPERLVTLTAQFARLSPESRGEMLAFLKSPIVETLDQSVRMSIWNELTTLVIKHRKFSTAQWALTPIEIEQVSAVVDTLAPQNPQLRYRQLFSERETSLFPNKGNYEAQHQELERRRRIATAEIEATGGPAAIIEFARNVESSWRAGIAFGDTASTEADLAILPKLLDADTGLLQFAGGFVSSRFHKLGWAWVDQLSLASWTPKQVGQLLAFLPFRQDTWTRAHLLLGADESAYWSKCSPNILNEDKDQIEHAIDKFIECGRATAALQCLHQLHMTTNRFSGEQGIRALLAALDRSQSPIELDRYEFVELITAIQADPSLAEDDVAKVEWAYVPILTAEDDATPKVLWRQMARDPEFFCALIRLAYKSTHDADGAEGAGPQNPQTALKAYQLVRKWNVPPGSTSDGSIDGSELVRWIDAVKKSSADSGHLEIALTMVGHVLFYAPTDPDGFWIDRKVASLLNERHAQDMRNGYCTEALNSRGAYWVDPTGRPERALAVKYRQQAEELESAGLGHFAGSLRSLAQSYDADAERVIREHSSGER